MAERPSRIIVEIRADGGVHVKAQLRPPHDHQFAAVMRTVPPVGVVGLARSLLTYARGEVERRDVPVSVLGVDLRAVPHG